MKRPIAAAGLVCRPCPLLALLPAQAAGRRPVQLGQPGSSSASKLRWPPPRAHVYSRLFRIGQWWSDAHTYTGKAAQHDPEEGAGRLLLRIPARRRVRPPRRPRVRRSGQGRGVLGRAWDLCRRWGRRACCPSTSPPPGPARKLVVTYTVSGYQPDKGFAPSPRRSNGVLKEQVTRLKRSRRDRQSHTVALPIPWRKRRRGM